MKNKTAMILLVSILFIVFAGMEFLFYMSDGVFGLFLLPILFAGAFSVAGIIKLASIAFKGE